jgi:anti-sigma-K factor RskA
MRYDDPKLRELLAGEYALGLLPRRARARFERLMAGDAALRRLVGDWQERLAPLDGGAATAAPSPRVWQAIERQIGGTPAPSRSTPPRRLLDRMPFWRGWAVAATALAAVLLVYVAIERPAPTPVVIAVLTDQAGAPAWIATRAPGGEVTVAALAPQPIDTAHAFELWAIAGAAPRPLGLLAPATDRPLRLALADLPPSGALLAVSLEPTGGSPTGQPTGPVLYKGAVLPAAK